MERGFTLVELLVGLGITIVLAGVVTAGASRYIENGRKERAMAQFRDFQVGMTLFEGDYQKPPIPGNKARLGVDTIYGDPGADRNYGNDYLVAVLAGRDTGFPFKGGETFTTKETNPRNQAYITFPLAPDNKGGVGKDGRLYDPWGNEVIVAVNTPASPGNTLVDSNRGTNDRSLFTWGLAEYSETKPKDQHYVFWSYGKDGKKGNAAPDNTMVVPLAGSDDVISW